MTPFDAFIMADWSSANTPARPNAPDSIWVAESIKGAEPSTAHMRTRVQAQEHLIARLEDHISAGRRVLLGFDFAFGYAPQVVPLALSGPALWDWMAARVEDDARNRNNRFAVAAELNASRAGPVFWGRPPNWAPETHPEIPKRKPSAAATCFRAVERHLQAKRGPGRAVKSAVHIAGAPGVVGGQVLMGLPTLARLKAHFGPRMGCWPFEADALEAPLVLAEIYPSLLDAPVRAALQRPAGPNRPVKDAVQVALMVDALVRMQGQGALSLAFGIPPQSSEAARFEGWILGATDPLCLEAAMADAPSARAAPPLRDDCFALPQGVHWTPVDTALDHLKGSMSCVVGTQDSLLEPALGRVLAEDMRALRDNPPTANAAVDGYGFAHGTAALDMPLVAGRSAAGAPLEGVVPAGSAVRILTGAPVPAGVDTVVMQEDTAVSDGRVRLSALPKPGANTRAAGEDKKAGDALFQAGHVLRAPDLATLAALGHGRVLLRKRLRVGVLSTGDELAAPGSDVRPEQIYDANGPMLRGMIDGWGMECVDLGRAPDDRDAVRGLLNAAVKTCDAILTSGGASGGDEDHMSALLTAEGHQTLWRIAIKPGRPLALGLWRNVPVFGLPGNPVAAFVTAALFARPALGALAGAGWRAPHAIWLPARFAKSKKPGRREFLRARITSEGVEAYSSEGSGRVSGLSWADALIDLPEEAVDVARGDLVRVLPYASLLRL